MDTVNSRAVCPPSGLFFLEFLKALVVSLGRMCISFEKMDVKREREG